MIQNGVAKKSEPIVPRMEFRHVSLAYDDQVVLDDVSFTVWPAELKLMLGESGGGKSTVIKLTLGLEKPDAGEIFIDGVRFLASKTARVAPGNRTQIEDEGERFCLANTRVMMLHHGRIIFEGPDELFWKSNDPVIREFVEYDTALQ